MNDSGMHELQICDLDSAERICEDHEGCKELITPKIIVILLIFSLTNHFKCIGAKIM